MGTDTDNIKLTIIKKSSTSDGQFRTAAYWIVKLCVTTNNIVVASKSVEGEILCETLIKLKSDIFCEYKDLLTTEDVLNHQLETHKDSNKDLTTSISTSLKNVRLLYNYLEDVGREIHYNVINGV